MKKLLCGFISLVMFLSPVLVRADSFNNPDSEDSQPSTFALTLATEGIFIVASGIASREPRAFGGLAALMLPGAALGNNLSTPTTAVTLIGSEALAIYNLTVDKNTHTRTEIFQKNMIGWHALALVVGVTGYIMGDFGSNSNKSVSLVPTTDSKGAKLMYSYNF